MNVELLSGITYNEETFNIQGGTSNSRGNNKIKEDLKLLLTQEKGKFYPDPEFGSELHKYMFEPITDVLAREMRAEITELIGKYYPQLTVVSIDILSGENTIQISIHYSYSDSSEAEDEIKLALFNQIGN
jgi:phage baseplate assembly protein W